MENTHPLFRFAKDSWKLEPLATASYSGWTRTYLQEESTSEDTENPHKRKGKVLLKNGVKHVKEEEFNGTTTTGSLESSCELTEVDSKTSAFSPTSESAMLPLPGSETKSSSMKEIEVVNLL